MDQVRSVLMIDSGSPHMQEKPLMLKAFPFARPQPG